MNITVIIGLGNPGNQYVATRHNVGVWLLERIVSSSGGSLNSEKKVMGDVAQVMVASHQVRLLRPTTFMNESGHSVRRMLDFYKLSIDQALVIHDELDLPPGTMRLKRGGGHGGHNGLRDIISHCGPDFMRLRIGIGHPGHKSQVSGYVLKPPVAEDLRLIEDALPDAQRATEMLLAEGMERAMHFLHSTQPEKD